MKGGLRRHPFQPIFYLWDVANIGKQSSKTTKINGIIHEKTTVHPVFNLQNFLRNKLSHGAVYQFHEIRNANEQREADTSKRPKEVGLTPTRPAKRYLVEVDEEDMEEGEEPSMKDPEIPEAQPQPTPPTPPPQPLNSQAEGDLCVCITPEVEEEKIQMLTDVLEEDSQDSPD